MRSAYYSLITEQLLHLADEHGGGDPDREGDDGSIEHPGDFFWSREIHASTFL